MKLLIAGLDEALNYRGRITHLIAAIDPEDVSFLPALGIAPDRVLVLPFHDVDSTSEARSREREVPGSICVAPTAEQVNNALAFASDLGEQDTLLILCGLGLSRSTALAFAILCQAFPELPEDKVLQRLLVLRPMASPNPGMVRFSDRLLQRKGRMNRALRHFLNF